MNRLGLMVDVSHTADKTFYNVVEVSTAPIIASHSACRAVVDFTRNMTEDMIKAIASKSGTMQISFSCDFLSQAYYDKSKPDSAPSVSKRRNSTIRPDKPQPSMLLWQILTADSCPRRLLMWSLR